MLEILELCIDINRSKKYCKQARQADKGIPMIVVHRYSYSQSVCAVTS